MWGKKGGWGISAKTEGEHFRNSDFNIVYELRTFRSYFGASLDPKNSKHSFRVCGLVNMKKIHKIYKNSKRLKRPALLVVSIRVFAGILFFKYLNIIFKKSTIAWSRPAIDYFQNYSLRICTMGPCWLWINRKII